MLLVQLVQLCRLLRNVREQLGHLVLNVDPPRGQEIHLNDRIAIVFKAAGVRYEPATLFGLRGGVGEAIGRPDITWLLGWVVRERLAVGDISGKDRCIVSFSCQLSHMG